MKRKEKKVVKKIMDIEMYVNGFLEIQRIVNDFVWFRTICGRHQSSSFVVQVSRSS